jgi:hypothetical protein
MKKWLPLLSRFDSFNYVQNVQGYACGLQQYHTGQKEVMTFRISSISAPAILDVVPP